MQIENMQREINVYKHDSDLLKNFDNEFVRISKNKSTLDEQISQIKLNHQNEIRQIRDEVELEIKKRMQRFENNSNQDYEFQIKSLELKNKSYISTIEELKEKEDFYRSEIEKLEKAYDNINQKLENDNKTNYLNTSFNKDLEYSLRNHKNNLESEFLKRLDQKENEKTEEIAKINKKYEKLLMEEYRNIEKLEKEKNNAVIFKN